MKKKECNHPLYAVYSTGSSAGPKPDDNYSSFTCGFCGAYIRGYHSGKVEINGKVMVKVK